jgi:hypothetical protein
VRGTVRLFNCSKMFYFSSITNGPSTVNELGNAGSRQRRKSEFSAIENGRHSQCSLVITFRYVHVAHHEST